MDKITDLIEKRSEAHSRFLRRGSKVYEAFLQMQNAAFSEGVLASKTKELIAIGIAIHTNCESCMQWHIENAAKVGATEDEVFEAIEIAIEMGGGPATVSARFALTVMDNVFGPA
ncbi:MAG: carboxymuconolactone decarboxylase family protein [Hyphomicrobiales bacterium]|nr:MAG: carboxymuconolactone decarboxylase family protein [Hyphomicrobiales bacterium]